jgi:hypothetical protein
MIVNKEMHIEFGQSIVIHLLNLGQDFLMLIMWPGDFNHLAVE